MPTEQVIKIAIIAIIIQIFVAMATFIYMKARAKKKEEEALREQEEAAKKPLPPVTDKPAALAVTFESRLQKGLATSRNSFFKKLGDLFKKGHLDETELAEVEELLYGADLGPTLVTSLVNELATQKREEGVSFKQFMMNHLKTRLAPIFEKKSFLLPVKQEKTKVIMVVGVNGAGKTTTIGKLATKLQRQGSSVVVGACDTFRAAAVDQLQVWCDRAQVPMVRLNEGAAPSGAAYATLEKALSVKADYCIIDTAGRLHTKENLMEELKKMKRVLTKLDESAPHEVLLVIDAVTGQNAIRQAEEFHKALELTGLIFTKCDGSSKAGSGVGIMQKLELPIVYIGVGEDVDDLDRFDLDVYLEALLDA